MFSGSESISLSCSRLLSHSALVEELFPLQPDVGITIAAACGSIEGVKYYLEFGAAIRPLPSLHTATTGRARY
jgi:hypothetical protein